MARSLPSRLMLGAAFGGAAMALTGCVSLDRGYNRLPPAPLRPPVTVPVIPAMPVENLPAGIGRVAYYGPEAPGTIVVDLLRHRLYHMQGDGTAVSYPIASPRDGASIPPLDNVVTRKAVNPTWTPTDNMRARNPSLPAQVPGGVPENPLGVRALYLGSTLYRIHGTNEPESIGRNASSGCIRMLNEHVIHLYERVAVGTTVRVHRDGYIPGIGGPTTRAPGLY